MLAPPRSKPEGEILLPCLGFFGLILPGLPDAKEAYARQLR